MNGKGYGLVLDIGEGRPVEVADHVRRHAVDAADLRYLELPRLQKLGFIVRHGDSGEGHALLEDGHAIGVGGTTVSLHPCLPQRLRVLHRVRVRQYAAGRRAVGKELAAILLRGDPQADGIFLDGNRAVAHDPVKAQAGDVEHILRAQPHRFTLGGGIRIGQLPRAVIPIHLHVVRQQRVQSDDLPASAANDLTVRVAPQQ